MNGIGCKKIRNSHDRNRRKIIVVVVSDPNITEEVVRKRLSVESGETFIHIVQSQKKGVELINAVNKYIKNNGIRKQDGDRVYLSDEGKWLL